MCLPCLWPWKHFKKIKKTCSCSCTTRFHKYQTRKIVFYHIYKHWEESRKIKYAEKYLWQTSRCLENTCTKVLNIILSIKNWRNKNINNVRVYCWLQSDIQRPSWSWFLIFKRDELLRKLISNISKLKDHVSSQFQKPRRVQNTIM